MTRHATPQEFESCRHCGRPTRKPTESAKDRPGTVKASSSSGEVCITCVKNPDHVGRWLDPSLDKAEKEARIAQARRDLEAMWADRRARGVDPDGLFFEGEKVIRHTPATFDEHDKATDGEGMGTCPKGHPYTHRDSKGYRRCATCLAENGRKAGERLNAPGGKARPFKSTERCPRGHVWVRRNGRVHCPPCENAARRRKRAERRRELDYAE
jgi:hypothetical protein